MTDADATANVYDSQAFRRTLDEFTARMQSAQSPLQQFATALQGNPNALAAARDVMTPTDPKPLLIIPEQLVDVQRTMTAAQRIDAGIPAVGDIDVQMNRVWTGDAWVTLDSARESRALTMQRNDRSLITLYQVNDRLYADDGSEWTIRSDTGRVEPVSSDVSDEYKRARAATLQYLRTQYPSPGAMRAQELARKTQTTLPPSKSSLTADPNTINVDGRDITIPPALCQYYETPRQAYTRILRDNVNPRDGLPWRISEDRASPFYDERAPRVIVTLDGVVQRTATEASRGGAWGSWVRNTDDAKLLYGSVTFSLGRVPAGAPVFPKQWYSPVDVSPAASKSKQQDVKVESPPKPGAKHRRIAKRDEEL